MHNRLLWLILGALPLFLIFFIVDSYFSTKALAVTSNCVITKVGAPAGDVALPPACNSGGKGAQGVIQLALKQLGKKYVFGGPQPRNWASWDPANNAPNEFDCSALVGWSWYWATGGKVNFPVSTSATWGHVPSDKFQTFTADQRSQIQPGDAIYFTNPSNIHHTALYEGPGNCPSKVCIIEAQQTGVPVKESDYEKRVTSSSDPMVGFIRPVNY